MILSKCSFRHFWYLSQFYRLQIVLLITNKSSYYGTDGISSKQSIHHPDKLLNTIIYNRFGPRTFSKVILIRSVLVYNILPILFNSMVPPDILYVFSNFCKTKFIRMEVMVWKGKGSRYIRLLSDNGTGHSWYGTRNLRCLQLTISGLLIFIALYYLLTFILQLTTQYNYYTTIIPYLAETHGPWATLPNTRSCSFRRRKLIDPCTS